MSDDLFDDDCIPPSPPTEKHKRLNVVLFRRTKRRMEETMEYSSESDVSETKIRRTTEWMNEQPGEAKIKAEPIDHENQKDNEERIQRRERKTSEPENPKDNHENQKDNEERIQRRERKTSEPENPKDNEKKKPNREVKETTAKNRVQERPEMRKTVEYSSESDINETRMRRTKQWINKLPRHGNQKDNEKKKPNRNVKVPTTKSPVQKRRRIREKKFCHECRTWQTNIWQHRNRKHRRDSDSESSQEKVVGQYGNIVYYCPVKKCGLLRERTRDHIKRKHGIKDKRKLKSLMKKARPLMRPKQPKQREIVSDSESKPGIIKKEPIEPKKERHSPRAGTSKDPKRRSHSNSVRIGSGSRERQKKIEIFKEKKPDLL